MAMEGNAPEFVLDDVVRVLRDDGPTNEAHDPKPGGD